MKKLFSIFIFCFLFGNIVSADDNIIGAGMANPASVNCEEKGGTNKIMNGKNGQYSLCVFDNGTSCEEWAFYREECKDEGEFINAKLYSALMTQEDKVRKMLDGISKETLEKAATSIEKLIENTKLSRLTIEGQKLRITQLVFLRYILLTEAANK